MTRNLIRFTLENDHGRCANGAHAILSDDHGRTWRLGAIDDTYAGGLNVNETTVVELNDGQLYFKTRDQGGKASGNAAVRSSRCRYIRYHDGGVELDDHKADPYEWSNLTANPDLAAVRMEHAGWITKQYAESAPTRSAFRFDDEKYMWTGKKTGEVTRGKDP